MILNDPDGFRIGIMVVDEVAHAVGVVFCRSPLGDFDFAPGTMHVEEDEQIERAIATILVIVTFEPAGLGRDGLTRLADELHRAFVEAHHRPLGVGGLGVEVKHVLHAGDVFAIDLRNAPNVLAPGLEAIFGQAPPNRLMRQAFVFGEFAHRTCQQLERPAGAPFWGLAQAVATSKASSLPESLRSAPGRGSSLRARSRLTSPQRRLVRYTVEPPTPTLLAISSSQAPASAASKICARLSLRDACLPPLSSALSSVRSIWLRSTR